MFHAIASVLFIVLLCQWLAFEFNKSISLGKYKRLVIMAAVFAILGSIISKLAGGGRLGNFLLHGIGGGVASAFLYVYAYRTFGLKLNWRLQLALLFAFVCVLGVLNELLEYSWELMGVGIFSFDTHDTWRDFVANSTGALVGWVIIMLAERLALAKNRGK